jgi:hypothetical protein
MKCKMCKKEIDSGLFCNDCRVDVFNMICEKSKHPEYKID